MWPEVQCAAAAGRSFTGLSRFSELRSGCEASTSLSLRLSSAAHCWLLSELLVPDMVPPAKTDRVGGRHWCAVSTPSLIRDARHVAMDLNSCNEPTTLSHRHRRPGQGTAPQRPAGDAAACGDRARLRSSGG